MIHKRICWLLLLVGLSSLTSFCFGQLPVGQFIHQPNAKGMDAAVKTTSSRSQASTTKLATAAISPAPLLPSIITMPEYTDNPDENDNYYPGATSTNTEIPITYTSDNPAVGYIINGHLHLIAPGVINITASQAGNANYADAIPVTVEHTFLKRLSITLPEIPAKKKCDDDFYAGAFISDPGNPATYQSSNLNVATVDENGIIHIVGQGGTLITVRQKATLPYYLDATPQSQFLVVSALLLPAVSISVAYNSPCDLSVISYKALVQNGGVNTGYQWMVNNVNAGSNSPMLADYAFKNGDIVTCIVTNQDNACTSGYPVKSAEAKVALPEVSGPAVTVTASANSVFAGTLVSFTATLKNISVNVNYQWYVNGIAAGPDNAVFSSKDLIEGDVVTCTVTLVSPCDVPVTSNPITVNIVEKITIPNTFTPNGDGVNDLWNIAGMASYPNNSVYIYNKYGKIVFQSRGYSISWNGTINGKNVPSATYYYVIDLGDKGKKLSGQLTILK